MHHGGNLAGMTGRNWALGLKWKTLYSLFLYFAIAIPTRSTTPRSSDGQLGMIIPKPME